MNKYLMVLKTSFKQESKTFTNSIVAVVSFFVIIYIFSELWGYIYGGSGVGSLINGYTLEMMIWYMIAAEILMYALNCRAVTRAFGNDIKTGRIAYQLNKPYNYYGYQIANQCGAFIWKLCFLVPAGLGIGFLLLGPITDFSAVFIAPVLLVLLLAALLTCVVYGAVGLLSFWIEEATPFTWIIQKFVMLFGLFFPPEFFPGWLQPVITYSPVFALISGPGKLLASFSWELFLQTVTIQAVYLTVFFFAGYLLFTYGTRKVNIHGG